MSKKGKIYKDVPKVYAVNLKIVNIEINEFYIDSIRNLMCIQFSEKLMQFDF